MVLISLPHYGPGHFSAKTEKLAPDRRAELTARPPRRQNPADRRQPSVLDTGSLDRQAFGADQRPDLRGLPLSTVVGALNEPRA